MFLWILILALVGLADASYLLYKKLKKEKLMCFLGEDCDKVSKSKHGYFLGIPSEAFGIAFYLFAIVLSLLSFVGVTAILGFSLSLLLLFAAIPASLVSLYLLGIQALILKEWCEWCMLSAIVNFLILVLLVFS